MERPYMKILGIFLIVVGLLMFVYKGINFTTEKKVVDVGPLEINKEEKHSIPLSPIVGGLALVGGVVVLGLSRKQARI